MEIGESAACAASRAVHTVGHSTRTIETFLALVAAHAIECVVDVRRWPASRRHPHFAREALSGSLAAAGVDYVWRRDLGGYRTPAQDSPNTGWRIGSFRAYADFMATPEFDEALAAVEGLAARHRVALLCAEAVPWRCHRQLLADAFTVRGWAVRHIADSGCAPHRLTVFARPEGTRLVYPAESLWDPAVPEPRG
jgi:uncharacterized protein (DUF488 family)